MESLVRYCCSVWIVQERDRFKMVIALSRTQLQSIYAHADRTYPDECCGVLLGLQVDSKRVVDVRSLENAWTPEVETPQTGLTKLRRYWIAPEAMLSVMREARSRDLEVIGIYHSHPDHAAVPSECDRVLAWPQYSYLIVSVQQGCAIDCKSWILNDRHQFQPEPIQLIPSPTAFPTHHAQSQSG